MYVCMHRDRDRDLGFGGLVLLQEPYIETLYRDRDGDRDRDRQRQRQRQTETLGLAALFCFKNPT